VRRELFTFVTLLAAGRGGVNLFLDNGRVWSDLFDLAVVRFDVAASKEQTAFSTGIGFNW